MRIATIAFSLVWLGIVAFWLASTGWSVPNVQGFQDLSELALRNWQPQINFSYNAFHLWKFDAWIVELASPLRQLLNNPTQALFAQQLLILFVGLICWSKQVCPTLSWFVVTLSAAFCALGLFTLFGTDLVLFSAFCWFPWLSVSLRRASSAEFLTLLNVLLVLFFSLRLVEGANQLAIVLAPLAILGSFVQIKSNTHPLMHKLLLIGLVILPALYITASAPALAFPAYPWLARVVPDDNLPGITRPLIGPEAPLETIDREVLRACYSQLVILLAALSLILWFVSQKSATAAVYNRQTKLIMVLAAFLLIDINLTEALSQIGPLATIPRIVPGLVYFALSPCITFLVVLLSFNLLTCLGRSEAVSLLALIFCCLGQFEGQEFRFGTLLQDDADKPYRTYTNSTQSREIQSGAVFSPSYRLLKEFGLELVALGQRMPQMQSKAASDYAVTLRTSHRERAITRSIDGKLSTRWSAKRALQQGDEWIEISFSAAETLSGLELNPGSFFTDFPRGLKISYSSDCSATAKSFQVSRNYPRWQGVFQFTADGVPFFGSQSEVKIYFENDLSVCKLPIEQTGQESHFDWSVSEINFLVPSQQ